MKITYLGPLLVATQEEMESRRLRTVKIEEEIESQKKLLRVEKERVKLEQVEQKESLKQFLRKSKTGDTLNGRMESLKIEGQIERRIESLKQQMQTLEGEIEGRIESLEEQLRELKEEEAFSGFSYPEHERFKRLSGEHSSPISGDFDPDANEPVVVGGMLESKSVWVFRRKCFLVEGANFVPPDEIASRIKHAAYREEKALEKIQKEVAAFENFERLPSARRERIPESVRLFVWQRDCGRCVKCESNERLEFDHIIPVAEGGSSTERNVQLLCERCNRTKGKVI